MKRRKFSREFKLEAVRLLRERGVAVAHAARDLDLHENMLRRWARRAVCPSAAGLSWSWAAQARAARHRELRREVAKVKAERDIPNEAAAYFARDSI